MVELAVRLVLGCGVITAVLFGLRYASQRGMAANGGPALRVVGRTGLSKNAIVAVIDVDDHRFLVGAADQGGVQLLADLGPTASTDDVIHQLPGASAPTDDPALDLDELAMLEASWAAPDADSVLRDDVLRDDVLTTATHGSGHTTSEGPRIGPLDRLREMTVRSHLREPIRAQRHLRR